MRRSSRTMRSEWCSTMRSELRIDSEWSSVPCRLVYASNNVLCIIKSPVHQCPLSTSVPCPPVSLAHQCRLSTSVPRAGGRRTGRCPVRCGRRREPPASSVSGRPRRREATERTSSTVPSLWKNSECIHADNFIRTQVNLFLFLARASLPDRIFADWAQSIALQCSSCEL
jgi:hypothetical protein